jgi:hypothetical protein
MMGEAHRRAIGALFVAVATLLAVVLPAAPARAAGPRIDLEVLVVSDGGAPVSAIEDQLATEGVPYRTVDLRDPNRPVINAAFLADTVNGAPRAKYQAVVLPNANPFTDSAEMTALAGFERAFGIRQLDAFVFPGPGVGLNGPGYAGTFDGGSATVTANGLSGPFRYLRGPVRFEDNSPSVSESFGYLATPLPADPATGAAFVPYLTATAGGQTGNPAGVYTRDGRSEMVLTFAYNAQQWQFRTIGHGIISWLTKGVHLGHARNYFSVHVDDVFLPDERWSIEHNCTPGEDCPAGVTTDDIRMTAADVTETVNWQTRNGFPLDMYFNGHGSVEALAENGSDPLTSAFLSNRSRFRWADHTYEHLYLGCRQDFAVVPWRCQTDAAGNTVWASKDDIKQQIRQNRSWASARGLSVPASELVTGEHSGLRILPQQPVDNPNLAAALDETDVRWIGGDASRDKAQRAIGDAFTVPRYPMSVFFNTGTKREMADEYNWIYTSRANGGSGICEDNPATVTCIQPLDPATGYDSYIIPVDSRITLSHVLANDPRPHYAHQSNLTEDRILFPMLERILGDYRAAFAANTPVVSRRMADLGTELRRQGTWRSSMDSENNEVTAFVQDGRVTVQAPGGLAVPITVPENTLDCSGLLGGLLCTPLLAGRFGEAYAGERSGYRQGNSLLGLPSGAMS